MYLEISDRAELQLSPLLYLELKNVGVICVIMIQQGYPRDFVAGDVVEVTNIEEPGQSAYVSTNLSLAKLQTIAVFVAT